LVTDGDRATSHSDRRPSASSFSVVVFVFFFQAEDGIRDFHVTGVQTCALPICAPRAAERRGSVPDPRARPVGDGRGGAPGVAARSEERRVGKEWRARGPPVHEERKQATQFSLTL